jgi:hypothetical protein
VIDGYVGIEIHRERAAAAARVHQIFPGHSDQSGVKSGG